LDGQFSKAKSRPDGTIPVDIAIPGFSYRNHIFTDRRQWTDPQMGGD
jgi:hypothetical protein